VRAGTVTAVNVGQSRVRTHKLRGVGSGDPPYMLAATGGRVVTFTLGHTFAYNRRLSEPPTSLGNSWFFIPSATRGRVWLALLANRRTVALRGLREVTVGGRTTVAHTAKPPSWPLAALDTGLVIQRKTLELWNPHTGAIEQRLPGVFPQAVHGSLLASCDDRCSLLHVTDTRKRTVTDLRPGAGFAFVASYDGAFSPDGRLLAVPARLHGGGFGVAMIDLRHRTARVVPGARLARYYQLFAWSSSGWLYFTAGHGRIAAYHAGEARAVILPVRVPASTDLVAF
jgi:hypothetical protein